MVYTAMSLSDPVSGYTSTIMPRDGVSAMTLDVQPSVRAVSEDLTGASGASDLTELLSAAACTLSLRLWPSSDGTLQPEDFLDEIGPLLRPGLRAVLTVTNDRWPGGPRQFTVRFDSKTAPVSDPTYTDVAVSWKVPAGVWEAAAAVTAVINAYVPSSTGLTMTSAGLAMKSTGLAMPATSAPAPTQVFSAGKMPSNWTALLYGPCNGPRFANDVTGLTLEFASSLALPAGTYIELNSAGRTMRRNSDPTDPVDGSLIFSTSNWWLMQPGLNVLRYYPAAASPASVAQLTFRPAWMP